MFDIIPRDLFLSKNGATECPMLQTTIRQILKF